jgi:hypothetical protein
MGFLLENHRCPWIPSVSVSVSESNGSAWIAAAYRKTLVDTDSDIDPDTD